MQSKHVAGSEAMVGHELRFALIGDSAQEIVPRTNLAGAATINQSRARRFRAQTLYPALFVTSSCIKSTKYHTRGLEEILLSLLNQSGSI